MAMRQCIGVLCGLLALALAPPAAWSQEMDFGAEEGGGEGGQEDGGAMDWSEDAGEDAGEDPGPGTEPAADDFLGDLGPTEDTTVEAPQTGGPALELDPPEVWAVQRVYALRYRRFELTPRFGFSMNDQFVSHYGFGAQFNWYITEVLAIGLEGQWYFYNPESDINYHTSRSFRVVVPINEYWMGWYLNFQYVPMYGKFAVFNRWILHWDVFISGGLGVTMTRPIAVVDAEFRDFSSTSDWNPNVTFSIGIGGRTFLTRWLAIFAELRLYGFPQPLEERRIAPLGDPCPQGRASSPWCDQTWSDQRANPSWLADQGARG